MESSGQVNMDVLQIANVKPKPKLRRSLGGELDAKEKSVQRMSSSKKPRGEYIETVCSNPRFNLYFLI